VHGAARRSIALTSTLAVLALVPGVLGGAEAVAATYPTTTLTLYSLDDGARGKTTITWMTATHVTASIEICDRRPDSRGAIVYMSASSASGVAREMAYDHVLTGNGSCIYLSAEVKDPRTDVAKVTFEVCNGGSKSNPQYCDVIRKTNPLDGG
jgi:hypothetical protein